MSERLSSDSANRLLRSIAENRNQYLYSVSNGLSCEVFSDKLHKSYFTALDKLFSDNRIKSAAKSTIIALMKDDVAKDGNSPMFGIIPMFVDEVFSSDQITTSDEIKWAIDQIRSNSALVNLADGLSEISSMASSGKSDSSQIIGEINKLQINISKLSSEKSKIITVHDVKDNIVKSLTTKEDPPVTTGFPTLDNLLFGGFQRSYLTYVCGRPGMCKTQVLVNMALRAADSGKKVLFMTYELPADFIVKRILAYKTRMNLGQLIGGANSKEVITQDDIDCLLDEYSDITKNIRICSSSGMNIVESVALIKNEMAMYGVEAAYLDYVGIIRTADNKVPERESDFAGISFMLRELAASENIPVIVAAQLNREVEKRKNKRPQLSDLRSSGSFENDARIVLGLYRDEYYNPATDAQHILEMSILKNTNGELRTINNFFNAQKCMILELDENMQSEPQSTYRDNGKNSFNFDYDDGTSDI